MSDYKNINIYHVLNEDFVEHVMRQELTDVAEEAEEMYFRTAARTLLAFYTVQQPDESNGKADS